MQRRSSEYGRGIDWFAEIAVTNLPQVNQAGYNYYGTSLSSRLRITISPATTTATVVLSGLTINKGSPQYSMFGSDGDGGGTNNINGTLTINNSTISGNSARAEGGINGVATLQNSIVANNSGGNCSASVKSKVRVKEKLESLGGLVDMVAWQNTPIFIYREFSVWYFHADDAEKAVALQDAISGNPRLVFSNDPNHSYLEVDIP